LLAAARAQTTNTEAQSSGTTTKSTDLQSRVRAGLKARLTGATEKIQAACGEDTKSFCGNVTRGEGKLLMCMMAHEDKISVKCDYALYAATRDIGRGLDKVSRRGGRLLERHRDELQQSAGGPPYRPSV
jgi:hypothetical protein